MVDGTKLMLSTDSVCCLTPPFRISSTDDNSIFALKKILKLNSHCMHIWTRHEKCIMKSSKWLIISLEIFDIAFDLGEKGSVDLYSSCCCINAPITHMQTTKTSFKLDPWLRTWISSWEIHCNRSQRQLRVRFSLHLLLLTSFDLVS